jgi:hypothetical protein
VMKTRLDGVGQVGKNHLRWDLTKAMEESRTEVHGGQSVRGDTRGNEELFPHDLTQILKVQSIEQNSENIPSFTSS